MGVATGTLSMWSATQLAVASSKAMAASGEKAVR
jgi:hypothetical protein